LGLALIIVFDHHANYRLGAARPEDYPAALAKFLGSFLDRAYQVGASDQNPFFVGNVEEYLRVPGHHLRDASKRPFASGHDGQEVEAYEQAVGPRGMVSNYDAAGLRPAQRIVAAPDLIR